ncbi:TspO/MBR family protein [Glacieibacterium frigidum]|nr:TspO/MBR family protein [Glacieibacterium frigidum]
MTRSPSLAPLPAAAIVTGALVISGLISRRYTPDPTHPRVRRWYKALDKPPETPPDIVFGGVWPILLMALGYGTYRVLRAEPSPDRTAALALAGTSLGLVTAYNKITFGDRNLTLGTGESVVLVATAASFVVVAHRVDAKAAAFGAPLALWSSFGAWLTLRLARRNPALDAGA